MASDELGYMKQDPSNDEENPNMSSDELGYMKQEPSNDEENPHISTMEDIDREKDAFYMPQHFLSANDTGMPSAVEQNPSAIESEESEQGLGDSMNSVDRESFPRPEHFLSQTNNESDEEGVDVNRDVGASGDPRYTLLHFYDGGKKRNMYSCNSCEEDFMEKRVCIRHVRAHIWAGKPFPCNQCEKAFDKRWMLDRHLKTHKTRDFGCSICGKAFLKNIHLIDHMVRLHGAQYQNISINEESDRGLEEKRTDGENMDAFYMPKHFLSDNNTGKPLAVEQNPSIIETKESDRGLEDIDHDLDNITKDNKDKEAFYMEKHFPSANITGMPLAVEQNPSIIETGESDRGLEGTDHGLEDIRKDDEDKDSLYRTKHFPSANITGMPLSVEQNPSIIETKERERGLEDRPENADKEAFFPPEHFLSQTNNNSDEEGPDVNHVVGASAETLYTLTHIYDTGRKIVRYSCNVCEKGFKDRRICIRHIRVHTGEKPFKCYLCGRGFGREDYLRRHIESHLGQKLFTCPLCNKDFARKDSLEDHLLTHTDMSERPFQCDQCDKGFIKKTHLKRHLKTHSLVRDFICTTCGKGFNEKRHLLDHMNRRHSDKEQPTCKICDREFWSEYHYRKHMEAHEDASEEQILSTLPIFVSKEEREIQNDTQNSSIETSDSHSLFGPNVQLGINDGLGIINNDAVPQTSDTVEANNSYNTFANSTYEQL